MGFPGLDGRPRILGFPAGAGSPAPSSCLLDHVLGCGWRWETPDASAHSSLSSWDQPLPALLTPFSNSKTTPSFNGKVKCTIQVTQHLIGVIPSFSPILPPAPPPPMPYHSTELAGCTRRDPWGAPRPQTIYAVSFTAFSLDLILWNLYFAK